MWRYPKLERPSRGSEPDAAERKDDECRADQDESRRTDPSTQGNRTVPFTLVIRDHLVPGVSSPAAKEDPYPARGGPHDESGQRADEDGDGGGERPGEEDGAGGESAEGRGEEEGDGHVRMVARRWRDRRCGKEAPPFLLSPSKPSTNSFPSDALRVASARGHRPISIYYRWSIASVSVRRGCSASIAECCEMKLVEVSIYKGSNITSP